ncbi:MAG: hypothetical protein GX173_12925 [Ruminococcaceae bacterium]|jgi:hypothetical protein|nr:hypothetical protein [Oscillospiraceae bacterium]
MFFSNHIVLSPGRILVQASPYIVVALLLLLAVFFLIRHFRGQSSSSCCGSVKDSQDKTSSGANPCAGCAFAACPSARPRRTDGKE